MESEELKALKEYYKEVETYLPSGKYKTIVENSKLNYLMDLNRIIGNKEYALRCKERHKDNIMTQIMWDQVFTTGIDTVTIRGEQNTFKLTNEIIMKFEDLVILINNVLDNHNLIQCDVPNYTDDNKRKVSCQYMITCASSVKEKINLVKYSRIYEREINDILNNKDYIYSIELYHDIQSIPEKRGFKIKCA